ncbi:MAG: glycoside hydrolase family 31 protein [Thermoleophilaceae bacterium]|nr:glycoside hydrolase family 31 protein [Thermoleophilaceae bacterium]
MLPRLAATALALALALPASAAATVPERVPGELGFTTEAGSFHATRAITRTLFATDDPDGRRLAVWSEPDGRGVTELHVKVVGSGGDPVTSTEIGFRARPGERYLGFGERSNRVDQRGGEVESYVAEGPYEEDDQAVIPVFVPPWGYHPRPDATYFPIPWLLSTAGYGVLVDNPETSFFRLDQDGSGTWSVAVEAARIDLRVFAGPRPADVLRRFSERVGRQPAAAEPFFFGPWYQPTGADEQDVLTRLVARDAPLSVAQTYTHYLPCASQTGREDAERARVRRFHDAGVAITTYFNPMICTTHPRYADATASGALAKDPAGDPYEYRYSTLTSFDVAQFDFTARAGRDLYGALLREAVSHGHDGWMEDFGEYTPLDARAADGTTGTALHNAYPRQYHCSAFGGVAGSPRGLARFVRSGWTGSARCSPIVWGGDPTVGWGFDGLRSVVTNGLTMGLSGVSTWGSDIGGFFALFGNELTPELLVRWIELGAVSGVMRTQANGIVIPDAPRAQIWDDDVLPHWRRWAKLRTQLYPYLAAADAEYRRSGLPIMRHLVLAYPADPSATAVEDAFLFGPDLLAAPVLDEGAAERSVYLPRGDWVDLWRSASYRESDGGLTLGRARLLSGGRDVTLPAPLGELPLLARAGTLLTLLPPEVDTLASYGDSAPVTSLAERAGRRVLVAFPRGDSSARLEDGGELRSSERHGRWRLSLRARSHVSWDLQASLSTLRRPFRPCDVRLDGRRVPWSYDAARGVLSARFGARRGELSVRACASAHTHGRRGG